MKSLTVFVLSLALAFGAVAVILEVPEAPAGIIIQGSGGGGGGPGIAVGATVSTDCDSGSDPSFSHTTDADTDVLLVYVRSCPNSGSMSSWMTSVTWTKSGESGQAMTEIAADNPDGGEDWSEDNLILYVLASPNIGAGTIAINDGGGTNWCSTGSYAVNVTGADTTVGTSGVRDTGSNTVSSAASISETVTTVSGDLMVGFSYGGSNWSDGTGETTIADEICASEYDLVSHKDSSGSTGSLTHLGSSSWSAFMVASIAED